MVESKQKDAALNQLSPYNQSKRHFNILQLLRFFCLPS